MKYSWFDALNSEGSNQMKFVREIMKDLQLMKCVPISGAVAGQDGNEETNSHFAVCENIEGEFLCFCLPSGGNVSVNLNLLKIPLCLSDVKFAFAWWWNLSDGKFYNSHLNVVDEPLKVVADNGLIKLSAQSEGDEKDWVLILMNKNTKEPKKDRVFYEIEKQKDKKVFVWYKKKKNNCCSLMH